MPYDRCFFAIPYFGAVVARPNPTRQTVANLKPQMVFVTKLIEKNVAKPLPTSGEISKQFTLRLSEILAVWQSSLAVYDILYLHGAKCS